MEISIAGFHPSDDEHGGVPSTQVVGAPSGPTTHHTPVPKFTQRPERRHFIMLTFLITRFESIDIGITSHDEIGIEQGDL